MIYYLLQGEAYQYPLRMAEMQDSGAEVIFLTWDKQIEGSLFLPNSTWAEGRDFMLHYVLKNNYNFDYLVFIDGDAKPAKGSWRGFNNFLLKHSPQICLPLMPRATRLLHRLVKYFYLSMPRYQRAMIFDEQVIAYRKDVITQASALIHLKVFENISWWYGSRIRFAILKYLVPSIIQFNALRIENDSHGNYPQHFDIKYITDYLGYLKLPKTTYFDRFPKNKLLCKLTILFYCFVELFYWFPLPVKQFDIKKKLTDVEQCINNIDKEHLI